MTEYSQINKDKSDRFLVKGLPIKGQWGDILDVPTQDIIC